MESSSLEIDRKMLYTVDSVDSWDSKKGAVMTLSASPCGKYVAVGTSTTLKVFRDGNRSAVLRLPVEARTVMWSWKSRRVAVSDNENMILILTNRLELESSLDTSARLAGFRGETDLLTCDSNSLRRHRMMSGSSSNLGDTIDLTPWLEEIHCVSFVATSRGRSRVAIGGRTSYPSKSEEDLEVTSSILVFDVFDRAFTPCYHIHFDTSEKITLPLLSATSPRTVSFATRVSKLCRRHVPGTPIVSIAISQDASNISALDKKGRVVVWSMADSSSSPRRRFVLATSSRAARWWSNDSVLILLADGGLILASIYETQEQYHKSVHTVPNRFGNSPEYFAENSSISSRLANRERMFVLERQNEESTLWSLSRATPMQVLQSKLNDREYGSALALCRTYDVDRDIVFKHRWRDLLEDIIHAKSLSSTKDDGEEKEELPRCLTRHHIKDILGKIKDMEFVTNQCSSNWPDTETSLRQLLEFARTHVDDDETRARFEQWLKRLSTYRAVRKAEKLQGNQDSSRFQVNVFEAEYKSLTIQDIARNMARSKRLAAVEILLKRHAEQVLPFRLDMILQHIPETIHPDRYAHLLPAFQPNKDLVFTSAEDSESDFENEWKDEDEKKDDDGKSKFYWDLGRGAELVCEPFESTIKSDDRSKFAEWALRRAKEIDRESGLIRHAHALLKRTCERLCLEDEEEELTENSNNAVRLAFEHVTNLFTSLTCLSHSFTSYYNHPKRVGNISRSNNK